MADRRGGAAVVVDGIIIFLLLIFIFINLFQTLNIVVFDGKISHRIKSMQTWGWIIVFYEKVFSLLHGQNTARSIILFWVFRLWAKWNRYVATSLFFCSIKNILFILTWSWHVWTGHNTNVRGVVWGTIRAFIEFIGGSILWIVSWPPISRYERGAPLNLRNVFWVNSVRLYGFKRLFIMWYQFSKLHYTMFDPSVSRLHGHKPLA